MIDQAAMLADVGETCACGAPATANGRECGVHYRERLGSVGNGFTPTRSASAHRMDPSRTKRDQARLARYKATREEGSQPATTRSADIDRARAISDATGKAFRADSQGRLSA